MSKVLIVSPVANYPETSGNSSRVNSIVKLFATLGSDVQFCLAETPFMRARYTQGLREMWGDRFTKICWQPRLVFEVKVAFLNRLKRICRKLFCSSHLKCVEDLNIYSNWLGNQQRKQFESLLCRFKPDVIVFEYAVLAEFKALVPDGIVTICDTHDVFTDRNTRLRSSGVDQPWISMNRIQEKRLLSGFDYVWAIQKNERLFFYRELGIKHGLYALDIVQPSVNNSSPNKYAKESLVVGFISSYNPQNKLGLDRFLEQVWPVVIKQIPHAKLRVAGSICKHLDIRQNGVEVIGRVDQLGDFYNACSLIINPVIGGSGLKIKTIEALTHGRCVVATIDGSDGLDYIDNDALSVVDSDWQNYSCLLLKYLADECYLASSSIKAREAIDARYVENTKYLNMILG